MNNEYEAVKEERNESKLAVREAADELPAN